MRGRGGVGGRAVAGAIAALVTGVLMAVIAARAGGLAASMLGILALTLPLLLAGVLYGWLLDNERLRVGFGPGILYWVVAFPVARLSQELLVGSESMSFSEVLGDFMIFQAMVGSAFGLGFFLLHNQISAWMSGEEPGGAAGS
jgi:hypothetical protein